MHIEKSEFMYVCDVCNLHYIQVLKNKMKEEPIDSNIAQPYLVSIHIIACTITTYIV